MVASPVNSTGSYFTRVAHIVSAGVKVGTVVVYTQVPCIVRCFRCRQTPTAL